MLLSFHFPSDKGVALVSVILSTYIPGTKETQNPTTQDNEDVTNPIVIIINKNFTTMPLRFPSRIAPDAYYPSWGSRIVFYTARSTCHLSSACCFRFVFPSSASPPFPARSVGTASVDQKAWLGSALGLANASLGRSISRDVRLEQMAETCEEQGGSRSFLPDCGKSKV